MEGNDTLDDEILLQHGGAEINKLTDIVGLVPDEDGENDINVINHSNYCVADKLPTFLGQDHGGLKNLKPKCSELKRQICRTTNFYRLMAESKHLLWYNLHTGNMVKAWYRCLIITITWV